MRLKTQDCFAVDVLRIYANKIAVIGKYRGASKRVLVECDCGHRWNPVAADLMKGDGCGKCARKRKRKTHDQFVSQVKEVHGNKVIVIGTYVTGREKILVRCSICGYQWFILPFNLLYGAHGCHKCAGVYQRTHEDSVNDIHSIHRDKIIVIGTYRRIRIKVAVKCTICGCEWLASPRTILGSGGQKPTGCHKCAGVYRRSHDEFLSDIAAVHGDKITVLGRYERVDRKIVSQCTSCGHKWSPYARMLLQGTGCPRCTPGGFDVNKPGICYYVRITSVGGVPLYKIGVTNRTVTERFAAEAVEVAILDIKRFASGSDALALERKLLKLHSAHRYQGPRVLRWTRNDELFRCDVLGLDTNDVQLSLFSYS